MRRLWVDANVILRYLTGEPRPLAESALRLMRLAEQGEVELRLHPLVLAEVIWVLSSFYRLSREQVGDVVGRLVVADGMAVEDREAAIVAISWFQERGVDFVDAYLAAIARRSGDPVCTPDVADFERLPVEWCTPEKA